MVAEQTESLQLFTKESEEAGWLDPPLNTHRLRTPSKIMRNNLVSRESHPRVDDLQPVSKPVDAGSSGAGKELRHLHDLECGLEGMNVRHASELRLRPCLRATHVSDSLSSERTLVYQLNHTNPDRMQGRGWSMRESQSWRG
eukprot:5639299-Pyramimonas_sp.AAC.2